MRSLSFYVCPVCRLPGIREYKLCRHCAGELHLRRQPVIRDMGLFKTRSLFSWEVDGDRAFEALIYTLKGVEDPGAWRELALWMAHSFGGLRSKDKERSLIVPIPGRRPNHSKGLARALANVLGIPLAEPLISVEWRSQKTLSREERREVKFMLRGEFLCTDYNTVLIVDDVITTGATAEAAHRALNRPRNCEVWTLMDRRPCDLRSTLL